MPFAFSSNGDAFLFHDRTGRSSPVERQVGLDEFPSPEDLWRRYRAWKGLDDASGQLARQPGHEDPGGKEPRYYQRAAIQRAVEAVARGRRRVLLVMATAEAPNGIARLREFVLQLAVRGKLVPQAADDEPAGSLLRQLKAGRKRLLEEGAIAKPRHPCEVRIAEEPFEIPPTWTWLRLGDVGAVVGGGTPKSSEHAFWADGDDVPWPTPADMRSQGSRYVSRGNRDITSEGLERSSAQLLP